MINNVLQLLLFILVWLFLWFVRYHGELCGWSQCNGAQGDVVWCSVCGSAAIPQGSTGSVPSDCWPAVSQPCSSPKSSNCKHWILRTYGPCVWILGSKKQLCKMTTKDDFQAVMIRVLFCKWGESAIKVSRTETPTPAVYILYRGFHKWGYP